MSACLSLNKYTEMMKLENQVATAVCKKITEQGGIYIPPFVVKNKPVFLPKITLIWRRQLQMEQIHCLEL